MIKSRLAHIAGLLACLLCLGIGPVSAPPGSNTITSATTVVNNVKDFGAVGDAKTVNDGAITTGTSTLTSATAAFTSADVTTPPKVIIVRGAGPAGIDLVTTISARTNGTTVTLAAAAGTTVGAARVDYGTLDTAAFIAAGAAAPTAGGSVFIPASSYMLGVSAGSNIWRYSRGNINVFGEGIGRSNVIYTSSGTTGAVGPGNGLTIGDGATHLANVTISDLTIRDVNSVQAFSGGHQPAGIETLFISQLRIARVELIDIKGNSAINLLGGLDGSTPKLPTESDAWITDFSIRAETSFIQGDGINVGDYRNVHVTGGRIKAPGRQGYEGGGQCYAQFIEGNYIDMNNAGLDGINPTGANETSVTNNKIYNVAAGQTAIDFTTDVSGAFNLHDLLVEGNDTRGGAWAVKFQNTGGTGSGTLDRFRVQGNRLEADSGVAVGASAAPNLTINGNTFKLAGFGNIITSTGADVPIGSAVIDIRGNVSNRPVINLTGTLNSWSTTRQLRIENNVIGSTLADTLSGGYGGAARMGFGGVISVPPGGAVISTGNTMTGAMIGDFADAVPDGSGWSSELLIKATVSAQDTVDLKVVNPTSAAISCPSAYVYVFLRRL